MHKSKAWGAVGLLVVLMLAGGIATGCSSESSDPSPQEVNSAIEDVPVPEPAEPPSVSEAEAYAVTLLPEFKSELKAEGADLFGDVSVKCAPTGGPNTECAFEIPYRRLDECAKASGSVFVVKGSNGVEKAPGSGALDVLAQVCYIGTNGEPVPSLP